MQARRRVWWGVAALAVAGVLLLALPGRRQGSVPVSAPEVRAPQSADVGGRPARRPAREARGAEQAAAEAPQRLPDAGSAPAGPDALPGEAVVRFYDGADYERFIELAGRLGVEVADRIPGLRAVRVRTGDGRAWSELLRRGPLPVGQGFNHRAAVPAPPPGNLLEDPAVRGFGRGAASWIGLPEDRHTLGQGVLVAVLDTAIEPVWWLGREQIERVDLVGDGAANGHGAAVASIVGGRGEWLGMAPGAELLAVAVMDADGRGDTFSVARGIVTAADRGARIINLCLGSRGDSDVLREAVAYARARGAVLVAAVGNEAAGAVLYPAAYEGVVGVTAIEGHGTVAGFANRGAGVDLAAPGVGMSVGPGEGGGDVAMSGTSAAAPVVSGLLAALLSENPGLSGDDAVAVLRAYADEAGLPGEDAEYGSGIVNMTRVEERNEPDVVDVAVVRPYVRTHPLYADELLVTLMAQNQGTVPIDRVELQVDRNGARQDLVFRGVRPGQTVSHELRIPVRAIPADGLRLDVRAVADGGADARATNDRVSAVLRVPAGSG